MRIEIKLMYMFRKGKRGLYDADGNPVLLDEMMKQFRPTKDMPVLVDLLADDFRHEEIPFDAATARLLIAQKKRGYFCVPDGRKVNVYNGSAAGEFPFVGVDATNHPCVWDRNGIPANGDKGKRLIIRLEIPAPDDSGGEEAGNTEAAPAPEDGGAVTETTVETTEKTPGETSSETGAETETDA